MLRGSIRGELSPQLAWCRVLQMGQRPDGTPCSSIHIATSHCYAQDDPPWRCHPAFSRAHLPLVELGEMLFRLGLTPESFPNPHSLSSTKTLICPDETASSWNGRHLITRATVPGARGAILRDTFIDSL